MNIKLGLGANAEKKVNHVPFAAHQRTNGARFSPAVTIVECSTSTGDEFRCKSDETNNDDIRPTYACIEQA